MHYGFVFVSYSKCVFKMRKEISDCNIISFFPFSENQKPDESDVKVENAKIKSPVIAKKELEKVKNFECSVCLKKFRSKDNMQLHRKIHNDIKNTDKNKVKKSAVSYFSSRGARGFSYPSLGKPFDIEELRRRLKTCKLCSITFDTKKLYNGHMKLHLVKDSSKKTEIDSSKETEVESSKETEVDSSKEMEVDSSKETEASHVTLVDQKAVVHGEKKPQFACENCEKTFTRNAYMKKHLILCSKKNSEDEKSKKHQCKFCNRKFSSNKYSKIHMKYKHNGAENDNPTTVTK